MTFNNISAGDPGNAAPIMQNFRHINYGNDLIPVNSSGSGVDDTLDLGSATYRFKDAFFSGDLTVDTDTLYVDSTNNRVGIGITSLNHTFEIKTESVSKYGLRISRSSTPDPLAGFFESGLGDAELYMTDVAGNVDILLDTNGDSYFKGGNVGIGTDAPDREFHVFASDTSIDPNSSARIVAEANAACFLQILKPNGTVGGILFSGNSVNSDGRIVYDDALSRGMEFYTAGSSQMVIDSTGNVGIGIDSPMASPFNFQVGIHVSGTTSSAIIDGSTSAKLILRNSGHATLDEKISLIQNVSGKTYISASADDFASTPYDFLVMDHSNGNVGINTDAPSTALTVNKNSTSAGVGAITLRTDDSNDSFLTAGVSTSLGYAFITSDENGTGTVLPLTFRVGADRRMTIDTAGNVGINTTGPDRKLDILDASNPQMRLTHTDGSVYSDFQADSFGNLYITPSGDGVVINGGSIATDGFQTSDVGSNVRQSYGGLALAAYTSWTSDGTYFFGKSPSATTVSMPLNLPHNVDITELSVLLDPNSSTLQITLNRLDSAGTPSSLATVSSSSATKTSVSDTTISNATIDNDNYTYYLTITSNAANQEIWQIDIEMDSYGK